MPASEHAANLAQVRRTDLERWRRRSRLVRVARLCTLGAIGAILLAFTASVAVNALRPAVEAARESSQPIRLINPRFVGRDSRGRGFVITANSATRDQQDYQKVYFDRPALILDEQGPDPMRISARSGVYREDTGQLHVSGGVRLAWSRAAFDTAESKFDTKTGELIGSGPVQGSGALGEIDAKSYGVYDKGERLVFQGGVHTRLNPKK